MSNRIKWRIAGSAVLVALVLGFFVAPARGDAISDRAEAGAVQRGKSLFGAAWKRGGKTCAKCHGAGRNKMTAARLKSYPKYDKGWKRVITAQQKINQMIKGKAGGAPLTLGSADLNALEAYISRLR